MCHRLRTQIYEILWFNGRIHCLTSRLIHIGSGRFQSAFNQRKLYDKNVTTINGLLDIGERQSQSQINVFFTITQTEKVSLCWLKSEIQRNIQRKRKPTLSSICSRPLTCGKSVFASAFYGKLIYLNTEISGCLEKSKSNWKATPLSAIWHLFL